MMREILSKTRLHLLSLLALCTLSNPDVLEVLSVLPAGMCVRQVQKAVRSQRPLIGKLSPADRINDSWWLHTHKRAFNSTAHIRTISHYFACQLLDVWCGVCAITRQSITHRIATSRPRASPQVCNGSTLPTILITRFAVGIDAARRTERGLTCC